jgi:glucose-6-phosphate-specific signal transduction histidine kinase
VIEANPELRGVRYPEQTETTAWYVVSEAMTNAVKHAAATRLCIRLSQQDGQLTVEVSDDGRGFDPGRARGLGLTGLADRMAIAGGALRVGSRPGHGTTLQADLPLPGRTQSHISPADLPLAQQAEARAADAVPATQRAARAPARGRGPYVPP